LISIIVKNVPASVTSLATVFAASVAAATVSSAFALTSAPDKQN